MCRVTVLSHGNALARSKGDVIFEVFAAGSRFRIAPCSILYPSNVVPDLLTASSAPSLSGQHKDGRVAVLHREVDPIVWQKQHDIS